MLRVKYHLTSDSDIFNGIVLSIWSCATMVSCLDRYTAVRHRQVDIPVLHQDSSQDQKGFLAFSSA